MRSLQYYCNFTATRRRRSLELVQSKKASRAKPTLFSCFLTATRRRRSLELIQSKKASHAKPTLFLQFYCDPATLRFFTSEVKRPGADATLYYKVRRPSADATLRRIQAQAFGWINYWRPHMHVRVTINYRICCIKNILNLHT